ncbi:MAG: acireductone synthase [Pyrinomonadaceae bacterium]
MTSGEPKTRLRGILLDIEGTTTPIAFVHDVLFPYARLKVKDFLNQKHGTAELHPHSARLREEHENDFKQNLSPPALLTGPREVEINSLVTYVNWLMDRNRKSTGLKALQGEIWKRGYLDGTLKADVFPDVTPALERWHRMDLKIGIFSSGSTLAQTLLFEHTEAGDLSRFISNYFDTTVGSKTDVASYHQIAKALSLPETEVLFISDVVDELAAAKQAGMQTRLCVRPGNPEQKRPDAYQIIHSFSEVYSQRAEPNVSSPERESNSLKEYEINLEMWRHYDNLRQEKNKTFLTVNTILVAAIGFALKDQQSHSPYLVLFVSVLGMLVSVLWFLLLSRNAAYVKFHRDRLKELEPDSSIRFATFTSQDEALRKNRLFFKILTSSVIDRSLAAFVAIFWLLLLIFRRRL